MDTIGMGFFDNAVLFLVHSVIIIMLLLATVYAIWFASCVVVGKLLRLTLREYNLHRESQELKHFLTLTKEVREVED